MALWLRPDDGTDFLKPVNTTSVYLLPAWRRETCSWDTPRCVGQSTQWHLLVKHLHWIVLTAVILHFFCSIKVISCKLNTSLLSYWLNEAQLKKVSYCRLTRREVFFFYPPKNVQNMSSILHKKLQTLTSGRDITNLFASCRLWVTDVGSDVIWVKATDHILFNSTKLFF